MADQLVTDSRTIVLIASIIMLIFLLIKRTAMTRGNINSIKFYVIMAFFLLIALLMLNDLAIAGG